MSPELIKPNFIINCHPGLIPFQEDLTRLSGLLIRKKFLEIHYIMWMRNVDLGKIIAQNITPILKIQNSLEEAAKRHYESEGFQCS